MANCAESQCAYPHLVFRILFCRHSMRQFTRPLSAVQAKLRQRLQGPGDLHATAGPAGADQALVADDAAGPFAAPQAPERERMKGMTVRFPALTVLEWKATLRPVGSHVRGRPQNRKDAMISGDSHNTTHLSQWLSVAAFGVGVLAGEVVGYVVKRARRAQSAGAGP